MPERLRSTPPQSLEERIQALELELAALRPKRRQAPRTTRGVRRGLLVFATILAVVVVPMAAFASDAFTDVPDGHLFHDDISAFSDARITSGCTATTYCPSSNVTRGQMAAFLNRGLPRASAIEDSATVTTDAANVAVASVTIETGGLTGGVGYVVVTGSVTASTALVTTCPCEVGVFVRNVSGGVEPTLGQYFNVGSVLSPGGFADGTGSMSWVFEVPTGVAQTFAVMADVNILGGPTPSLELQGQVSAVFVPFGSAGTVGSLGLGGGSGTGR